MNRIRWYGPTLVLLLTVLLVMILGPGIVRQLAWARTDAEIRLIQNGLSDNPSLQALSDSFRQVALVVEPSVVHIEVSSTRPRQANMPFGEEDPFHYFFGRPRPGTPEPEEDDRDNGFDRYNSPQRFGNGSGWVYDEAGHIVTNFHVINGADVITVRFHDGSERKAKIVGKPDEKTDVAVIKVEGDGLHPATLAPEQVEQGDIVFAFGSPFAFDFSMSQGIVSGKGRKLGILNSRQGYENFIQTDAAINPGNSGGPLTNIKGQVVGMNSAIATRTGQNSGLGFAIPIDMVKKSVDQIIEKGKVSRGYLGVMIQDLKEAQARTFGYDGKGVLIAAPPIDDSPAQKAGLRMGDIITKLDDKPLTTADDLRNTVADIPAGTNVKLEVYRQIDGKAEKREVDLTIGEQPEQMAGMTPGSRPEAEQPDPSDASMRLLRKLGIEGMRTYTKETALRLGQKFTPGVLITGVRPGSIAQSAGVANGMIVTRVLGEPVANVEELITQVNKQPEGEVIRLSIVADGEERFVFLEAPEKD